MKPVSHRAKLKDAKRAAENAFLRWYRSKQRMDWHVQIFWPKAFLAGVRWQKRQGANKSCHKSLVKEDK